MGRWQVVTVLACFIPIVVRAEEPADLVKKLGDPAFSIRDGASRKLAGMGRAAYAAVRAGLNSANPEVRRRCEMLLPQIYDLEMNARIEAFVKSRDPSRDPELPGWARFRAAFGSDKSARDLYIRLIKADIRLFDAIESNPKVGVDQLANKLYLQRGARVPVAAPEPGFDELLQVLYLTSHPDLTMPLTAARQLATLTMGSGFRTGIQSDPHAAQGRKIYLGWVERYCDDMTVARSLDQMLGLIDSPEVAALATRIVLNRKLRAYSRAQLLLSIGRCGAKAAIPDLEKILDDNTRVSTILRNGNRSETQIRDVALAVCVKLAGLDPTDFGFPNKYVESYHSLGFPSDTERDRALRQWQATRSKK